MSIKITSEEQILNPEIRALIIKEIVDSRENRERRFDALRKHEIYRDKNKKWILQGLANEGYKDITLYQMHNRAVNISICKKLVNKLAQAYIGGVSREVEDQASQESINQISDELDFDTKQRKSDRYRQLHRNTLTMIVPVESNKEPGKHELTMRIMAPWQYDVIEDNYDPTQPRIIVLSDFHEQHQLYQDTFSDQLRGSQGRRPAGERIIAGGDAIDQTIADSPSDKGMGDTPRKFIFWSDRYHFTCDAKGKTIASDSPEDQLNPIGVLPFVNIAVDQDGFFWAEGGEDIVDGSLLINKLLTDINFITYTQGWGQLVISAPNIPKKLIGGPDNAFTFEVKEGEPNPQVFYATSNPPIADWLETVKTTLAMLLSTNDLSPRNISAKLDVSNAASGVALLIEMSESTADIQEVQKVYQDKEPEVWEIIRLWHAMYHKNKLLVERFQNIPPFNDSNVKLKFHQMKPAISEKEQLDNIEKRKNIGINTMAELIQIDNPDLSIDDAKKRAEEIAEEKKSRQQSMMGDLMKNALPKAGASPDAVDSDKDQDDNGKIQPDKSAE